MLEVQKFLRENNGDFALLKEKYGISSKFHPTDNRVILNYSQIDSYKYKFEEIVRECRGLVLDKSDYSIVARGFRRFFNAGECLKDGKCFDWDNCSIQEKEDGSLILIYKYQGKLCVNTRNSFGYSEISPETNLTWEQLVFSLLPKSLVDSLVDQYTVVCELCSPFNKVIRIYKEPKLVLLGEFNGTQEVPFYMLEGFGIPLVKEFDVLNNLESVQHYIEDVSKNDPTFEGVVLRDCNNNRIKLKSLRYLELHRLSGNGNLFMTKNLVPLILDGEKDEVLLHFPEAKDRWEFLENKIEELKKLHDVLWFCYGDIDNRKKFAEKIKDVRLSCILFKAKDLGVHPNNLIKDFESSIVKWLVDEKG